jgi:hypothetical protein
MSKFSSKAALFTKNNKFGVLGTFDLDSYPFSSVVPYLILENSEIIIQIANIAEHHRNLINNYKGSLFITDPEGVDNPTKYQRINFQINWTKALELRNQYKEIFETKFPNYIPTEIEPSFDYFIGDIQKIRWIGGFAEVSMIEKQEFIKQLTLL